MVAALPRFDLADLQPLQVCILEHVSFEDVLVLQRRLVYEISGNRSWTALVLAEHPAMITIGREGSSTHLYPDPRVVVPPPVRWVNRGGGCLLQCPGQLAIYPILPLDRLELNLQNYIDCLHGVLRITARSFDVSASIRPDAAGVWVGHRRVAHVGIAVRDWVCYFGGALNVDPDLEPFRRIHCDGDPHPMTSLVRERRGPITMDEVRRRLIEVFAEQFGFPSIVVTQQPPFLVSKEQRHAAVTPPR